MQIEWSEEEVLKWAGVGREAEKEVGEGVGGGVDGRRGCEKGREVGIGSGAGRTGAERGEPCGVCAAKHSGSRVERRRLARRPKWRIRTKPLGSRCNRKRRRNSSSAKVISFCSLL